MFHLKDYTPVVLVQPRKTRPVITEKCLTVSKEPYQTNIDLTAMIRRLISIFVVRLQQNQVSIKGYCYMTPIKDLL